MCPGYVLILHFAMHCGAQLAARGSASALLERGGTLEWEVVCTQGCLW